ncbi:hypothetical protein [Novosphingobium sp. PY1]|uniref:hypothetical protein n=1 Tax=Novosphingobium sp. PY1 TaxID=1882221 RepID=UPI001A8CEC3F|nr:hypothetical protein [Novosphingobium sp. PY1]
MLTSGPILSAIYFSAADSFAGPYRREISTWAAQGKANGHPIPSKMINARRP